MNGGPCWSTGQRPRRSSGRGQRQAQEPRVDPWTTGSPASVSQPTEDKGSISPGGGRPRRKLAGSGHQGALGSSPGAGPRGAWGSSPGTGHWQASGSSPGAGCREASGHSLGSGPWEPLGSGPGAGRQEASGSSGLGAEGQEASGSGMGAGRQEASGSSGLGAGRQDTSGSGLGAGRQDACGSTSFLVPESVKMQKEDAEEDSASDLSDSERVPFPPSPLTPPLLELRAEEIDPHSFDLHLAQDQTQPEHAYSSFLPRPYSSWDLRHMAWLLHAEHRAEAVPRVGGLLGKYLDRLLQLEWLQIQTVQCEKSKGAKARLPPGLGIPGAPKSPGRSKFLASALSKPPLHQEVASKSGPSRKQVFRREEVRPSCYVFEACLRPADALRGSSSCSQKQKPQVRSEEKSKEPSESARLQCRAASRSGRSPKVEASGNIRIPRHSAATLDSADPCKTPKSQTPANLKKNGSANNCGNATMSGEKKLRTNRAKQSTHRLKTL